MRTDQKKIGVVLNYAGEGIKAITALLYTPVLLRTLGQSEYGLYQMVSSVVAYLSIMNFGFGGAYIRFYSRYKERNDEIGIARLNGMFMTIFCVIAGLCLVCGGVMLTNTRLVFGNNLTDGEIQKAKVLLVILVINMALTFPNIIFNCYISAQERFLFQRLLQVLQAILSPFLSLPLLLLGYGSVAVVTISLVLTIAVFLVNIAYCRKKLKIAFAFRNLKFSLLREVWVFTFFIFLNQIIDQLNWNVDKLLLGRLIDTESVAVYGIGAQINTLYLLASLVLSTVFIPKVNQMVARNDDNRELVQLMTKVGRIQFMTVALVLTAFAFFGQAFIQLWAGTGYEEAYFVALFLIVPMTMPLTQCLGLDILRAKNLHKTRSIVYIGVAAINVVLSIFLIRFLGCSGAAIGTAISIVAGDILFMNWYYHKRAGLDMVYFWKNIARLIPAVLLACGLGFVYRVLVTVDSWIILLLSGVVYTMLYAGSMWLVGMNAYEKGIIKGILQKLPFTKK